MSFPVALALPILVAHRSGVAFGGPIRQPLCLADRDPDGLAVAQPV